MKENKKNPNLRVTAKANLQLINVVGFAVLCVGENLLLQQPYLSYGIF